MESFIKEKRLTNTSSFSNSASEVFSVYKLKSKVMQDKLEKIKTQFDSQNYSVDGIKRLFEESIQQLQDEIKLLKDVASIDNPDIVISPKRSSEQELKIQAQSKRFELMQSKQEKLETQLNEIIKEVKSISEQESTKQPNGDLLQIQ